MRLSPSKISNLGVISDEKKQVSRNYAVISNNKTSFDSKQREGNKSQF